MPQEFQNVWLSTEEKLRVRSEGAVLGFVFEDKGVLKVNPELLEFQGRSHAWSISRVQNIASFHFKPRKVIQAVYIVLVAGISVVSVLLLIELSLFYLVYRLSLPLGLSILLWVMLLTLLTLAVLALIFNFSSLGPLGSSRWVKVDYLNEQNQPQTVYFADGSWLGWGGILGETQKMHKNIEREISSSATRPS